MGERLHSVLMTKTTRNKKEPQGKVPGSCSTDLKQTACSTRTLTGGLIETPLVEFYDADDDHKTMHNYITRAPKSSNTKYIYIYIESTIKFIMIRSNN